jgi:YggT family protein
MGAVLGALVDPLLRPIRRVLPPLGGLDLSPLVLLVVAQVVVIALSHAYPLFM